MPGLMDKWSIIRSLYHTDAGHSSGDQICFTGYPAAPNVPPEGPGNSMPSCGSIVAKQFEQILKTYDQAEENFKPETILAQLTSGLRTINGIAVNGDPSGENDREVETTTIDSIGFGDAEFRNVTAVVRPQRITKDYPDVDGILGFALFNDYLLTLDYRSMQVKVARGTLPAANGADILNFEIENRIPVIEVAIGRIRVRAHIDSGNFVAGFILPEEIVEQLQLVSQPVVVGRARSVSNQIELKQVQLKDTIRIGGFDFPQPTITFPALSDTNVGFKVLRDFALTFDQKNRRVKLVRLAAAS